MMHYRYSIVYRYLEWRMHFPARAPRSAIHDDCTTLTRNTCTRSCYSESSTLRSASRMRNMNILLESLERSGKSAAAPTNRAWLRRRSLAVSVAPTILAHVRRTRGVHGTAASDGIDESACGGSAPGPLPIDRSKRMQARWLLVTQTEVSTAELGRG